MIKQTLATTIWHDAKKDLPNYEQEVIAIHDDGMICYRHRTKREDVLREEFNWAEVGTKRKIVLWAELPFEEIED